MDSTRLKREKELNAKTVNVGTTFYREKLNYGFLSRNSYYLCKVIAKEKNNITFEQYTLDGEQINSREMIIKNGYVFDGTFNHSINSKLQFRVRERRW